MRKGGDNRTASQSLKAVLGIRDLVFSGAIGPGERLSEVTVAERLGLSRTPVRSAFARLEREGVLEPIRSGGYAVRAFSAADVIDAIELRGVLEGTAARLAAERGVAPARMAGLKALVAALDDIVSKPLAEMDFQAYIERNAAFHGALAALAGSEVVRREVEQVTTLPFSGPSAFIDLQADIPEPGCSPVPFQSQGKSGTPDLPGFRASLVVGQAHHRAIVEAIELREGPRAEAVAREHARLARQNLDFVMRNKSLMSKVPGLSLVSD